jgi:hypothetical protein
MISGSRQLLIGLKRTDREYRDSAEDVSKLDIVRLLVMCFNRTLDVRLESGLKSRSMNFSSVYLRRSGCLYVHWAHLAACGHLGP